jgi:hypothetical protein
VRLEEESRKSKPRPRGADLRITDGRFAENRTPECGVRFHARISSTTVGPRKSPRNVQVSRDVDRPVTIKASESQGDKEKFLVFGKRTRRSGGTFFLYGFVYRSAGDLACRRPVRSITSFFCCLLLCYLSFSNLLF